MSNTDTNWRISQEPKPKLKVERREGILGPCWKVTYHWEFSGRKFSYGSGEIYAPEEQCFEEVRQAVHEVVDTIIRGLCATVEMFNNGSDEWLVKVIKRSPEGLYVETLKSFCDFEQAVAYIKDVKYVKLNPTR